MATSSKGDKVTIRVAIIGQTTSRKEHLKRTKIVHTQVRRAGKRAAQERE